MGMTAEEAQPTLHAVYPETVYEVGMRGWHFAAIHAARQDVRHSLTSGYGISRVARERKLGGKARPIDFAA